MTMDRDIEVTLTADQFQNTANQIATSLSNIATRTEGAMNRVEQRLTRLEGRLRGTAAATRENNKATSFMNANGAKTQAMLHKLSSAAAGTMMGMSLLQGNITNVGFGLIFLQFAALKVALAAAALTVVIGGSAGLVAAFTKLEAAGIRAGAMLEKSGQQLTNYFRSAKIAQEIMSQGDQFARRFGIDRDQARASIAELNKVGLQGERVALAMANASAATGKSIEQVTADYINAIRKGGDDLKQFSKDYSLPGMAYANSLELAEAMNERFEGSAARSADTVVGAWNRIKNTAFATLEAIGSVWVAFIRPLQDVVLAFLDNVLSGFLEVRDAAKASGELKNNVDALMASVKRLTPLVAELGRFIGRGLAQATIWAARGLKVMVDAAKTALTWLKALRDRVVSMAQGWKEGADDVDRFRLALGLIGPVVGRVLAPLASIRINFRNLFGGAGEEGVEAGAKTFAGKIRTALATAFRGIARGIFRPDLLIKDILGGLARVSMSMIGNALRGLKTGLILTLVQALSLSAVDLLPIADNIKASLSEVLKLAFLGAAVGSVFGPGGAVVGGMIGLIIAGGLELAFPGTAAKINQFLDDVLQAAIEMGSKAADSVGTWIQESFVPGFRAVAEAVREWFVEKALPAFREFADNAIELFGRVTDTLKEFWDTRLEPVLSAIWSFITDKLIPALGRMADWVIEHVLPRLMRFATWLKDRLLDVLEIIWIFLKDQWSQVWKAMQDIFEDIQPVINAVVDVLKWLWDRITDLWQAIDGPLASALLAFWNFIEQKILPILDKLITTCLNKIKDWADDIPNPLALVAAGIDGVKRSIEWLMEQINKFLNSGFVGALGNVVDMLGKAGGLIGEGLGAVGGGAAAVGGWVTGKALGGTVPGRPGERKLVLAEAGEEFGGHPILAGGRPGGGGGAGTSIGHITIDLSGAVISDDRAINKLAEAVAESIFGRQTGSRRMTIHRGI
ncbi:MAG: hypothetical protein M0Q49_03270 [Porticoccaceae bacterium]|nr:hypothetical protein [Porticoccaceae bacterium]